MSQTVNNSNVKIISFHLRLFCISSNMNMVLKRCYYICAAPRIEHDAKCLLLGRFSGRCMFTAFEHFIILLVNHKRLCHRKILNKTKKAEVIAR